MIKFCKEQWDRNKDKLEQALRERTDLDDVIYLTLVKMVVDHIFNPGFKECFGEYRFIDGYDSSKITEIDNGDYQGTLLFLIPLDIYQPSEYEYLMTYIGYGSCSGCDTLQAIQGTWNTDKDKQISDFMTLCKDIVTNTIKPYNGGWRADKAYFEVVEEKTDETQEHV